MNIISIITAGLIGGTAAFIASIIVNKIFKDPDKNKIIKNAILMIIFFIFTFLGNKIILPVVENKENKSNIEKQLTDIEDNFPTFKYIKEHDREKYLSIIDEMNELYNKNKNKKPDELSQIFHQYGANLFNTYLQNASPELLVSNNTSLISVMKELNTINPELTCQMILPGIYGSIQNQAVVLNIMKKNNLFKIQEKIIIEGKHNSHRYPKEYIDEGSILLEKYRYNFQKQYPKYFSALRNMNKNNNMEEKLTVAEAFVAFNEGILSLEKEKRNKILRFMTSNQ